MALERLSAEDDRILRLESGPIAGHICKALIVDGSGGQLTPERLRAHVAARIATTPRLRQRAVATPLRLAPPVWADDPAFDVRNHVVELAGAAELDDAGLRAAVARLMAARLDRERPLWRIDVARMTEGRVGLVWRIHHCMADGVMSMRLGAQLLWDTEPEPPPAREAPAWSPSSCPGSGGLVALAARDRLREAGAAAAGAGRAVLAARRLPALARTAKTLPATLLRELYPAAGLTPLAARVGPRRAIGWTSAPLRELRAAGKSAGEHVTVNDVVLAAMTDALREWLTARGDRCEHIRAKVPVSLHRPGEGADAPGNRDSFEFVALPTDEPDPTRRLLAVNRETLARKRDHDAQRLDVMLRDVSRLPGGKRLARTTMSPHEFTFNVSNVPGPKGPLFILGRRVRELYSLAEIAEGHALRVSVISCSGQLGFAFCADADAVPDLDRLVASVDRSLGELLALV